MNANPKVAVILSTYSRNRSEGACQNLLKRAIESILDQTFTDFELILIDDGSKDGSHVTCKEYAEKDNRIKFFRFDVNSGIPAKRYNDGITFSTAPYITFMFDDDKWYPNAIQYLYDAITGDCSDCGFIYGLTNYMNVKTGAPLQLNFGAEWSWDLIDKQNFLCNNSVIVKRDVINDVGGYDESPIMRRLCDWDLWWRIGRKYKVKRILKLIGEVHAFHDDSIGVMVPYDFPAIRALQASENRFVRLQGELKKKLKFTFAHHGHDAALQRWRIWYLSNALNQQGHDSVFSHINDPGFDKRCSESDVIIFYRCYYQKSNLVRQLVSLEKLVVYDIDDYVFQVGNMAVFNSREEAALIHDYLKEVNCYSAATSTLLKQMPNNDKPRFVRRNAIDQETFQLLSNINVVTNKKKFRIGWTTGINRIEMHNFMESLLGLLSTKVMPGQIEFWYFGKNDAFYRSIIKFKNIGIVKLNYISTGNWKNFYKDLRMAMFDVVINPLEEGNIFFSCKSELKAIEHGALGYPLITSRVKPFIDFIQEGVNGYFASTPQEFVNKILHVKENLPQAFEVARNLQSYIRENHMIDKVANDFISNCLFAKASLPKPIKKNIISANYVPDIIHDNFGYLTEELIHPLIHEFISQAHSLCRVEYLGAIINKGMNAPVKLLIKNKTTNEIILNKTYNVRDFESNAWWGFEFPPVLNSANVKFEVNFIPQNLQAGNSFQLYMSLLPNPRSYFFTEGKKRDGHLAFKSYCTSIANEMPVDKKPIVAMTETVYQDKTVTERPQEFTRILIRKKGTWSEIIPLFPIIKHIKVNNPNTQIFVATNHHHVFENNRYIEKVIPWDSNVSNLHKKFDLENAHENDPKTHIIDAYAKLILNHTVFDKTIEIEESEFDREYINRLMIENGLKEKEFLVFHCALSHQNKTIPREKWNRLQAHCVGQGSKVVVIGNGSDFPPVIGGTINLVNRLNFFQSKYLIQHAKAIICLDGDYMQIAGATDTPIVGIFTATSGLYKLPYRKDILGHNCYTIDAPVNCFACWNNHVRPIKYYGCAIGSYSCINSITPQMILQRINSL
jgi:ADP-heptose:LPS heptosyltransferase/glycosyltransferase involved in cell wall biosynthesis